MQNLKFAFILLAALVAGNTHAAESEAQLQIKKFRFNHHKQLHFERLVLEFAKNGSSRVVPNIRLSPSNSGKETVINVQRANLVGAIPEASINDSYTRKSLYFGPISVNTDATNGFNIRTFIKQQHSVVDAFWLENPSRLIVDVFPKSSERAAGPNVVGTRRVASENEFVERSESKSAKKWTNLEQPKQDLVLCFPASSQVKANVGFLRSPQKLGLGVSMTIDNTFSLASLPTSDGIVCYPKGAQVTPTLNFSPKDNPFHGRVDMDRPERFADRSNYQPSLAPSMGMGNEATTNADADLALSLPEDDSRKVQSTDASNYEDNFNKNAPPPSLGKKLPPPGNSYEAPAVQLASPGGLLPPLNH